MAHQILMRSVLVGQADSPLDRPSAVLAAMRGDREAVQALWRAHRRWIAAVLLAHKAQGDQLEDLLQEVAMTLVARIHTLREPAHLRAWLRTVAVNAARASARSSRARQTAPAPAGPPVAADGGADPLARDEEARRLLALARRLPEAYREPLLLRALRGLRGREIAAALGLTEAAVETRIARGRRMLRELGAAGARPGARPAAVAATGPDR